MIKPTTLESTAETAVDRAGDRAVDRAEPQGSPAPARTPPAVMRVRPDELAARTEHDLTAPEYFLNRELTWLTFNYRVLHEAQDPRTPLLERLKFIAIVGSNLDEFYMKRIGGLMQQRAAGMDRPTIDGRTPDQQIADCRLAIHDLENAQRDVLVTVLAGLEQRGVRIVRPDQLDEADQEFLRAFYLTNVHPLLTPQSHDPAHPFPFVSTLSLNLLVTLRDPKDADDPRQSIARVKIPVGVGMLRFLQLPGRTMFVPLEDLVEANLDVLFPKMEILQVDRFRVIRNASTERDEEKADDLLALIETELRDRRIADVVLLKVGADIPEFTRGMLAAKLGVQATDDVFGVEGMLGKRDLLELTSIPGADLRDRPLPPVDHPKIEPDANVFHAIRDHGALLLLHPYESFTTSVERFLRDASRDPKVRAIKMTLYRTSSGTKVVDYLIDAARNDKQVAVVVELKARFDERANMRWAEQLEEAGIHVTYGVVGLKTHCKAILVVRQDYDRLRRYAHIGTGNYHAGTARLYCDFGLLTCDDDIGHDLTELFNYLTTGYTPRRNYRKLITAPKHLKKAILAMIEREIQHQQQGGGGRIQLKTNALQDPQVIAALYRASQAGVRVDLLVRDTCCLIPGVPGLSERISVTSTVGRFLEHSRVYYFGNGGAGQYFIGSADCMSRNLESRVEILVPIESEEHRAELRMVLDAELADQRQTWDMQSDGSYVQRMPPSGDGIGVHETIATWFTERARGAPRLRRRRAGGPPSRDLRR